MSNAKAHLALLCTNVFFAVNYSLVKFISPALIGPFGLNLLRVGSSVALFWGLWAAGNTPAGVERRHWPRLLLCALTGVVINQLLFVKGLTLTSTIHAALLMLVTPIVVTLFAFWVLKERFTAAKAAGLALGVGGATLLILQREGGTAGGRLSGDLLIVCNAISYSLYFILVKPLMAHYSPLHVVRWVFTIGLVFLLPIGWAQAAAVDWSVFRLTHTTALFWVCVPGTFLAYLFNIYGIQKLGAGITGSYIYTQPVFAVLIAVLFLNEAFTWQKLAAAALIFAGVYLVNRKAP